MAIADFSILTKVTFDEKDIQAKLNRIGQNLNIVFNTGNMPEVGKMLDDTTEAAKRNQDQISNLGLTYQEANMIMQASMDVIKSMVDQVYELDGALTEFKKVSDLNGASLDAYTDKLTNMGKEVARTGKPNRSEPVCTDGKRA